MNRSYAAGLPWLALLLLGALLLLAAGIAVLVAQWRRQQRQSQRQADWLQRVIDGLVDVGAYFLDPQGRVTEWSNGAQRLLGYEAGEIVGRHFSALYGADESAGRLPQDTLETAARQGAHRASSTRVRSDGRRLHVDALTEALRDASGRLEGFSCVERDVSEAMQQQQALQQVHAALAHAQRMAALGRLSGGIAHDFNNAMHVIRTCAQFLQRQDVTQAQARELLQMIKRNADRAAGLSQHLLSVARRPAASAALTDVNDVVTDVAQLLRQTLTEDITVELRLDASLSWCAIDRNELEAALLHVAADARDAMPMGGTVELATHESLHDAFHAAEERAQPGSPGHARRYVVVSISHWRGADVARAPTAAVTSARIASSLAPSASAAVANEFAAVADQGVDAAEPAWEHERDRGLGLTLTRSLIEQSQGEVHIESHPRGTTVRLYLPCRTS